jgi:hypothetical protein
LILNLKKKKLEAAILYKFKYPHQTLIFMLDQALIYVIIYTELLCAAWTRLQRTSVLLQNVLAAKFQSLLERTVLVYSRMICFWCGVLILQNMELHVIDKNHVRSGTNTLKFCLQCLKSVGGRFLESGTDTHRLSTQVYISAYPSILKNSKNQFFGI